MELHRQHWPEWEGETEVRQMFEGPGCPGGQVQMPLTKTFFSPRFGMVADRFGVSWMIVAEQKQA